MSFLINYLLLPTSFSWFLWCVFCRVTRRRRLRKCFYEKVVLITGASSGLGEAMARVFHRYGARLILASRDMERLTKLKQDLIEGYPEGFSPFPVRLDLEKIDDIHRIVEGIVQIHGRVDILVNNAGVGYRGTVIDTQSSVYMKLMSTNFFGHVELTRSLLPHFIVNRNGTIVGIGSVQSQISIPFRSAYAASKHAFQAFIDCLRAEMSVYSGINVLTINPGYIRTNASLNSVVGDGSVYNRVDESQATGMDPEEVAEEVALAIAFRKKEVFIAELYQKAAVIIRHIFPDLFFKLMARRAVKQLPQFLK